MTAFEGPCAERSALEAALEAARAHAARMLQAGHVVGAGRFLRTLPPELRAAPVLFILRATIRERVKQVARRFDERTERLVVEPRPAAGRMAPETHEGLVLGGAGHRAADHVAALRSTGYEADEARALIVSWLDRGLLMLSTPGGGVDDRVRAAPGMGVATAEAPAATPVGAVVSGPGAVPAHLQRPTATKIMARWWKPKTELEPGPGGR